MEDTQNRGDHHFKSATTASVNSKQQGPLAPNITPPPKIEDRRGPALHFTTSDEVGSS